MAIAEGAGRAATSRRGRERLRTRDQVLRAALELVDSEGMPALTIRRLAADLGIGVTTVYGYVRTKEEILDGVTRLALEPLDDHAPSSLPWERQLKDRMISLYQALRRHPGATQVLASGLTPGPGFDRFREQALGLLGDAGFDKAGAVQSLQALYSYVIGFAAAAGHSQVPSTHDADRLRNLSPTEFPALTAVATEFASRFSDESFEFGLDRLLHGVHAFRGGS